MKPYPQFHDQDLSVVVSELLIATADSSDPLLDGSVNEVLKSLRDKLKMDVVFVSEFVDGQRVFRFVEATPGNTLPVRAGGANPVEDSFCQLVVDGRVPGLAHDARRLPKAQLPEPPPGLGAYLSTAIVLRTGRTYGTLCCLSQAANDELRAEDLTLLRHCASLVARKLELAQAQGVTEPPAHWALEPANDIYESKVWATPMRRSAAG